VSSSRRPNLFAPADSLAASLFCAGFRWFPNTGLKTGEARGVAPTSTGVAGGGAVVSCETPASPAAPQDKPPLFGFDVFPQCVPPPQPLLSFAPPC
jgi:hypothetical protein